MATSLQHTISVIALTLTITAMIHSTVSSYAIHHRLTPPSPLPHITNPLHSLVIISALFLEIICLIIITILDIICLIIITILETILPQHYPYHCQDIGDYPIIAVAAAAVTIMGINTFVPHSDHQITIPWLITLNPMDSNTFIPHSDHRITALWIITSYHIISHFFAPSAKPFTHPYTFITNLNSYWTRYARKNQKSYCNTIYGIKYPLFVFAFSIATLTYPNVCTCYFYNFIKVMCVDLVYHHSLTP
eukprot:951352_1